MLRQLNEGVDLSESSDCIFCAIVAGRAPAHRVFEDERVLIFMDLFPAQPGHTLIIPKQHGETLFETSSEDLQAVAAHSKPLASAIRSVFRPDGIAVMQLNGAAAGQTVFHYHMHLIPRQAGDPFRGHGKEPGDPDELARHATQLGAAFTEALGSV